MSKYMTQNFKSIILKGSQAGVVNKEAKIDVTGGAGGQVNPGYLVELDAANPDSLDRDKILPHSVAGGKSRMFIIEDELQGRGIYGDATSDQYGAPPNDELYQFVADELLQYRVFQPGDQVLAVLFAVDGGGAVTVTKGQALYSKGDGTLTTVAAGNNEVIATAIETVTIPAPVGTDDRCYIPVEIV